MIKYANPKQEQLCKQLDVLRKENGDEEPTQEMLDLATEVFNQANYKINY